MSTTKQHLRMGYVYMIYGVDQNGNASNEVYIGSTFQNIKGRFSNHKSDFNTGNKGTRSKDIFYKYGVENCRIMVLTEVETYNKELLYLLEGALISHYGDRCVNKMVPGRFQYAGVSENEKRSLYIKNYTSTEKGKKALMLAKRIWARKPEQVEKRKQKWQAMKDKMKQLDELLQVQQKT